MIPQNHLNGLIRELFHFFPFSSFCIFVSILLFSPRIAFIKASIALDQSEQHIQIFEPDKLIESQLSGGDTHLYQIQINAGHYLYEVVEQKWIDVVVTLINPDRQKKPEINITDDAQNQETIKARAKPSGIHYRLHNKSRDFW